MLIAVFGAGQGSCWPAPHGRFPRWHHTGQPLEPSRSLRDFGRMRLAAALLTLVCLSACGGVRPCPSMRRLRRRRGAAAPGGAGRPGDPARHGAGTPTCGAAGPHGAPSAGQRAGRRLSDVPTPPRPLRHRLRNSRRGTQSVAINLSSSLVAVVWLSRGPYLSTHCWPRCAASAGVSQDHSAPRARMATQAVPPSRIRSSTEYGVIGCWGMLPRTFRSCRVLAHRRRVGEAL